jgi:hypothetical protein
MSDADATDATDPVKALREWCAEDSAVARGTIDGLLRYEKRCYEKDGNGEGAVGCVMARALLSAAPALLARIEAGEGLLRRGVGPMPFHYDRAIWIKAVDEHLAEIDASDETEAPRG